MQKKLNLLILVSLLVLSPAWAQENKNKGVVTSSSTIPPSQQQSTNQPQASTVPVAQIATEAIPSAVLQQAVANSRLTPAESEAMRYTLGPDDVVAIQIQRHPEFSGTFPVNLEGKIQMQFAGDVDVTGLTKKELGDKIAKLISSYVINPEVDVTILEYRSKYYLVIGEVNRPGRYFMRSGTTTVKDAIVEAGLPMVSAAMRKCVVITPDKNGRIKKRAVDVYAILYGGNLRKNVELYPGDTLYVPATVMAKAFRVIAPITEPVTSAAGAQTGLNTLGTRPINARTQSGY
ncbi:MAG: polysaccharide export protein [Candidatus Omnitrophica bacterium]|nr:polysaccharide export protein [Candidatus Omnitrophota bacterium]